MLFVSVYTHGGDNARAGKARASAHHLDGSSQNRSRTGC
jgi:hypothetical protein